MTNLDFMPEDEQQKVAQWKVQWDTVLRDGIIIDIHVSQWWPYVSLNPERMANLGIPTDTPEGKDAVKKVLKGGRIDLIPEEFYKPIQWAADRARRNVDFFTIDVMFGHLLPATAYKEWKAEHDNQYAAFWTAIDELCNNLDSHILSMRDTYVDLFSRVYDRLPEIVMGRQQFIEEAIADIRRNLPDAEYIRSRYSMVVDYRFAPMLDEISESETRAAKLRAESLLEVDALDQQRNTILEEMQREVGVQLEQRRLKVEESLAVAEGQFYGIVAEAVQGLSNALSSRGKFTGKQGQQLKNLIKQVSCLNVYSDKGLDEQISNLEQAFVARTTSQGEARTNALEGLEKALADTKEYVTQQIENIPKMRGVRAIETDDTAPEEGLRVSRMMDVEEAPELGGGSVRRVVDID